METGLLTIYHSQLIETNLLKLVLLKNLLKT